jgi:circadian clock protein KaiB
MTLEEPADSVRAHFDSAIATLETEPYTLTLFVSGASDSSAQAIADVRDISDRYLEGRYDLKIIDLNQEPLLALQHGVLATPTLVVDGPLSVRMFVGDMSDHLRILPPGDVPPGDAAAPDETADLTNRMAS